MQTPSTALAYRPHHCARYHQVENMVDTLSINHNWCAPVLSPGHCPSRWLPRPGLGPPRACKAFKHCKREPLTTEVFCSLLGKGFIVLVLPALMRWANISEEGHLTAGGVPIALGKQHPLEHFLAIHFTINTLLI